MKNKLPQYLKKISAWLLPYHCILCNRPSEREKDLCTPCYQDLPHLPQACRRCARPLFFEASLCGRCMVEQPAFDSTLATFLYKAPITQLIMQLKFASALVNARLLGELLAEAIQERPPAIWPEVIIPMPLHPARLKERGFNQAVEIGRSIATRLQLPLDISHCRRIKHTAAQATLSAEERIKNMKNAFHITNMPYRQVAVIDDVMTTGQTLMAFSTALKKTGVETIQVWCSARAVENVQK